MANRIFYIAEIGINHNGSLHNAKKLIDLAKATGFNAVKFQKRDPSLCVPDNQKNVIRDTPWGKITYLDYKNHLEFGKKEYDEIDKYCKKLDMVWFASAWDLPSQEFLGQYDLQFNKIASPMLTYVPLLEKVADEGKFTFISTGMSTQNDIDKAVSFFNGCGCPFMLMHTVSMYPCPEHHCNIKLIEWYKNRYNCDVGYSGHEGGLLPSVLSAIYDVAAIERHITLDRMMWGTDQSASLEKRGQELLIRDANTVKMILGNGFSMLHEGELGKAKQLRWWN